LKEFESEGIVELKKRDIEITDMKKLEVMSRNS